ncbi:MAG: imidazoleglycerol-phosphate dehydratase HisB [Victivallaceae bacterium]|nr:imidazoleglycerol-phosphate dehydratase HisB [Victivallaceae bacterium]
MRNAEVKRTTKETDIYVKIELDGTGGCSPETGIPFLDHMLNLFARHGLFDLTVRASGDLEIDAHHTIEDLGLTLGEAIAQALGDKRSIRRYGSALIPMDETLVQVALDLSGRPYMVYNVEARGETVGGVGTRLFHEFFQALSVKAGMNLHIDLIRGEEDHHIFEAVFKAFARALDMATELDERVKCIPSTKGML